jgi:transcriptional regulator GlxA family with amidase domain
MDLPSLAVCSGFEPEAHLSRSLIAWLPRLDQAGCALGGLDTGGFILPAAIQSLAICSGVTGALGLAVVSPAPVWRVGSS